MAKKDKIVVYQPHDLPAPLRAALPAGSGPEGCLFFFYGQPNAAISEMWDQVPEPDIDAADEGLAVARQVMELFRPHFEIITRLFPKSVPDYQQNRFGFGFHTAPAAEVRSFLEARAKLIPIEEMLKKLHIFRADVPHVEVVHGRSHFFTIPVGPGLHTLSAETSRPGTSILLSCQGVARAELGRDGGLYDLQFEPHSAEGLPKGNHLMKLEIEDGDGDGRRPATAAQIARGEWPLGLQPLGHGWFFSGYSELGAQVIESGDYQAEVELTEAPSVLELVLTRKA